MLQLALQLEHLLAVHSREYHRESAVTFGGASRDPTDVGLFSSKKNSFVVSFFNRVVCTVACSGYHKPTSVPRNSATYFCFTVLIKLKSRNVHASLQGHSEAHAFKQNQADGWKKLKANAVPTVFEFKFNYLSLIFILLFK